MGCDIHLYAEAKKKKGLIDRLMFWKPATEWVSLDIWETNEDWEPDSRYYQHELKIPYKKGFYTDGRNYNLFSALCGVRSQSFYGEPARISDPGGIPEDTCQLIKNEVRAWGSDGHSHNYNTLAELKAFDWSSYGQTCDDFRKEVIGKMEAVGVKDTDVRIVYFFDN